jgi:hypothetical protein
MPVVLTTSNTTPKQVVLLGVGIPWVGMSSSTGTSTMADQVTRVVHVS